MKKVLKLVAFTIPSFLTYVKPFYPRRGADYDLYRCFAAAHNGAFPLCHWTARAELGMGMLIASLGIRLIVFNDPKTRIGLTIGILLSSIIVIGLPHALIGGCKSSEMDCRRIAFPALTVEGAILFVYSIFIVIYSEMKKPN